MGTPKARLVWQGRPLVAHLAARIAPAVERVWLVAKSGSGLEDLGLPLVHDHEPEPALVHGIRAAIDAPGPEWRWIVACDMPGIEASVLAKLWRAARRDGAPGSYAQRPDETGRAGEGARVPGSLRGAALARIL